MELRRVGEPPALRLRAARPPRARRRTAGSTWSAAQDLRRALRLPPGRRRAASSSRSTASRSTGSCAQGFVPVLPPVLVREEAMYGTGFFPTERVEHLRGRARRALPDRHLGGRRSRAAHGRDPGRAAAALRRLLDELPARGGRRRQGHARDVPRAPVRQGRDVRLHEPERRAAEHERLLALEEELVAELGLPYRVVNIAAGDLGAPAAKKYDIEAWFPSQERYREVTSSSNTTDYQARRLDIRFRRDGEPSPSTR